MAFVLWDTTTGEERARLVSGDGPVHGLNFRSDGAYLLAVGTDYTIYQWDIQQALLEDVSEPVERLVDTRGDCTPECPTSSTSSAAYSPDGSFIASTHQGMVVRLWKDQQICSFFAWPEVSKNPQPYIAANVIFHPNRSAAYPGRKPLRTGLSVGHPRFFFARPGGPHRKSQQRLYECGNLFFCRCDCDCR